MSPKFKGVFAKVDYESYIRVLHFNPPVVKLHNWQVES